MLDLVDPNMREDGFVETDVLLAIHVAFLCLQNHTNLRPPMSEIVALLTCKFELDKTPPRPIFLDRRRKMNLSWDIISDTLPSKMQSESPSSPKTPTKGNFILPIFFYRRMGRRIDSWCLNSHDFYNYAVSFLFMASFPLSFS